MLRGSMAGGRARRPNNIRQALRPDVEQLHAHGGHVERNRALTTQFSERWGCGMYSGGTENNDGHILGTRIGKNRARSVRRLNLFRTGPVRHALLQGMRALSWVTRANIQTQRQQLGNVRDAAPAVCNSAPRANNTVQNSIAGSTAPGVASAPAGSSAAPGVREGSAWNPAAGSSAPGATSHERESPPTAAEVQKGLQTHKRHPTRVWRWDRR